MFYVLLLFSIIRDSLFQGEPIWAGNIAGNALFVFNFFPGRQEGIVWASWTIGVEMLYYALFPMIYLLAVKNKISLIVAVLVGYWFMCHVPAASRMYVFSFVGFIPIFILGELTFVSYANLRQRANSKSIGIVATVCGLALLAGCMLAYGSGTSPTMRYPIGLGYALLVLGFTLRPIRVLESRVLQFYGKISYSLYLCHAPLIAILEPLLHGIVDWAPAPLAYPICAAMALGVATAVGWMGYCLVEQPGNWSGKFVYEWVQRKLEPLSVAAR